MKSRHPLSNHLPRFRRTARRLVFAVLLLASISCSAPQRDYAPSVAGGPGVGGSDSGVGGAASRAGSPAAGSKSDSEEEAGSSGMACTAETVKCAGAEVETTAQKCGTTQSGIATIEYCSDSGAQCNPATGTCMKLSMDSMEVTRAEYAAFLAAGGATQVEKCAAINVSLTPDANCMAQASVCTGSSCNTHPQVCVDWCDAHSYCRSQGKRLCGRIGGGMNPFDRFADPGSSEWMNACSAGGQYKFGSGARVDSGPEYCNYLGTQLGSTHSVGTRTRCTSPSPTYDSFFDLSGNVAEWEDSCEHAIDASGAAAADACRTRGGSFASPLAGLSCDSVPASALRRDGASPEVGFRCCAE